jgi:hypothetical protein
MKNIVTFIRFFNIKELKRIEKRLIEYAKTYGFDIVHSIQVDFENSASMNLIETMNELLQENIASSKQLASSQCKCFRRRIS